MPITLAVDAVRELEIFNGSALLGHIGILIMCSAEGESLGFGQTLHEDISLIRVNGTSHPS